MKTSKGFKPSLKVFVATWQNEADETYSVGTVEGRTLDDAAEAAFNHGQDNGLLLIRCVDPRTGNRLQLQEQEVSS
jgi:hypothetical protein